jgi:hypothetical protein
MSTKVSLSSLIYPSECIEESISAYRGYCEIIVLSQQHPTERLIEIIPSAEIEDSGQLTNEFLNYLLDLSVEKYLEAT